MVNVVTLGFCIIEKLFIRDIRARFGVPNLSQSPDIEQNSDRGISDFRISGQSLKNENCPEPVMILTRNLDQY